VKRQVASADADVPREGQRIPPPGEDFFGAKPCHRPGCYELFTLPYEHSCKRFFASVACRLALRRVLDREARYQARRRHPRCERVTKPSRGPPDTS